MTRRPRAVDVRPAIRAGLLEAPFWLRRLDQWDKQYRRGEVETVRYRAALSEMHERLGMYALALAALADECERQARLLGGGEGSSHD